MWKIIRISVVLIAVSAAKLINSHMKNHNLCCQSSSISMRLPWKDHGHTLNARRTIRMQRLERPNTTAHPYGFSIIELLVTMAIAGVLLALITPAIQMARETSRRVLCQNNLKQIMLATQSYSDVFGSYPPPCETYGEKGYSWGVLLLPFLEQASLSEKLWGRGVPEVYKVYFKEAGTRLPFIDTRLSAFRCPSAPAETVREVGPFRLLDGFDGVAVSNYGGCVYGWSRGIMWGTPKPGVLTFPRDVIDGLSNTFAFGERSQPTEVGQAWNTWAIQTNGSSGFYAVDRMYTGGDPISNSTLRLKIRERAFSWHPEFCNFVFCDGSVRAISQEISTDVYQAFGGMADARVVTTSL